MVWLLVLLLAALGACKDRVEKFAEPGVVIEDWVPTRVAECGFQVELPNGARRNETVLSDSSRSVLYVSEVVPDKYLVNCIRLPASMPVPTPAQALRGQAENLRDIMAKSGLAITEMTLTDEQDGGKYVLAYSSGIRVEGRVYLVGHQIHDLSGSVNPSSARSEAQLGRVLSSYERD